MDGPWIERGTVRGAFKCSGEGHEAWGTSPNAALRAWQNVVYSGLGGYTRRMEELSEAYEREEKDAKRDQVRGDAAAAVGVAGRNGGDGGLGGVPCGGSCRSGATLGSILNSGATNESNTKRPVPVRGLRDGGPPPVPAGGVPGWIKAAARGNPLPKARNGCSAQNKGTVEANVTTGRNGQGKLPADVILSFMWTGEEAQAILAVLDNVGGHPSRSRRGNCDDVRKCLRRALDRAGLDRGPRDDTEGSVYFEDTK